MTHSGNRIYYNQVQNHEGGRGSERSYLNLRMAGSNPSGPLGEVSLGKTLQPTLVKLAPSMNAPAGGTAVSYRPRCELW